LNAQSRAQAKTVATPAIAEHLDVSTVGDPQALEDLDRRRLARAVRTEHAETLAAAHLEIETRQCHDVTVSLAQAFAPDRTVRNGCVIHSPPVYVRSVLDSAARATIGLLACSM
jgi:hypothetical protein